MRILHTLPTLDGGGIDRVLYEYSIRMAPDIKIDFIVHTDYKGILEDDLINKGCQIFHIPPLHTNRKEYFSRINKIIKNGHYDLIHVSQGYKGLIFLVYAKFYGIKTRIVHSHSAFIPESKKEHFIRLGCTFLTKCIATSLFACGKDAGLWMWGRKDYERGKICIMTNAINVNAFEFSQEKRKLQRDKHNLNDKFVIGNVARISHEKNHHFLIKVFSEIHKMRQDAVLILIGRGELEQEVRTQVTQLGLDESVLFMGVREDVSDLINAMDVFLLPSLYEGLPVTLVEVQANGLTSIVSDNVTKEIKIAENIHYLSLNDNEIEWAQYICSLQESPRKNYVAGSQYDIEVAVRKMMDFYHKSIKKNF